MGPRRHKLSLDQDDLYYMRISRPKRRVNCLISRVTVIYFGEITTKSKVVIIVLPVVNYLVTVGKTGSWIYSVNTGSCHRAIIIFTSLFFSRGLEKVLNIKCISFQKISLQHTRRNLLNKDGTSWPVLPRLGLYVRVTRLLCCHAM